MDGPVSAIGPIRLIDSTLARSLLSMPTCIAAVEDAFRAMAEGRAIGPALTHVDAAEGEFHIKAGGLVGARSYFACKVNGGFFQNKARHGLPNIVGLILLADAENGAPLAILESGYITRLRTGAASAVAAKYLARPGSRFVTVCGAGAQGAVQLEALKSVLPLERAFIWSPRSADHFIREHQSRLDIEMHATTELARALQQSDVIVTCMPSIQWYVRRDWVRPGTFIAAVGADSPTKRELEPALVASCSVVCDVISQCAHVGELHHAIQAGLMVERDAIDLGSLVTRRHPGRRDSVEITLFDSTGTALQDAAAAAAVYEQAVARGLGGSVQLHH